MTVVDMALVDAAVATTDPLARVLAVVGAVCAVAALILGVLNYRRQKRMDQLAVASAARQAEAEERRAEAERRAGADVSVQLALWAELPGRPEFKSHVWCPDADVVISLLSPADEEQRSSRLPENVIGVLARNAGRAPVQVRRVMLEKVGADGNYMHAWGGGFITSGPALPETLQGLTTLQWGSTNDAMFEAVLSGGAALVHSGLRWAVELGDGTTVYSHEFRASLNFRAEHEPEWAKAMRGDIFG